MHYQQAPYSETKLVRCVRGKIYDVLLDIRPESSTFMHSYAVVLDEVNLHTMYIPAGCAHGYLTMEENSLVEYWMDAPYVPQAACGIRYDDPMFNVAWPSVPQLISDRDAAYLDFECKLI